MMSILLQYNPSGYSICGTEWYSVMVKLTCQMAEWSGGFGRKHKEWKERTLECKLLNWVLDLALL
jgi:hypothetical protein